MSKKQTLVTMALPYANGDVHLGNLLEAIQTDIFVRVLRANEETCHFVSGSDAHGTPIMLNAQKQGIGPEELITKARASQEQDFAGFSINFDHFHTTHSEKNNYYACDIYNKLQAKGDISQRAIMQAFDPEKNMFLPDRFIKGECPRCHAADQYGDNCEVCGATYSPAELINPVSALTGVTPINKESEHYFFELGHYEAFLKEWTATDAVQPQMQNKLSEWFDAGLKAWDISRDAPYFGFTIPGTTDKYFYVWMDAPIGYMASFAEYCEKNTDINFDDFWREGASHELYHFIGKDIMYFHNLFWPAMLKGAGYRTPTAIYCHGFLTLDGQKMSKSRGTFIKAKTYLEHLNPEYLRYYLASKLNAGVSDIDLCWDDFTNKVNADLVGKVINIASRCANFISKRFDGKLASKLENETLFEQGVNAGDTILTFFKERNYHLAVQAIMRYADSVNQYIDANKPWELIKDPNNLEKVHLVCTQALNCFKLLMTYLKPIIPTIAQGAEDFLQCEPLTFINRNKALLDTTINRYQPLVTRVCPTKVETMQEQAKQEAAEAATPTLTGPLADFPLKEEISFDDFAKLDLRIVTIVHAEAVEGADKLIKVIVDMGGIEKQVFAGIKKAFSPEELIGKQTVMVANLAPRKMRFGLSEGMLLVASGKETLWLISPQEGAEPGTPVK